MRVCLRLVTVFVVCLAVVVSCKKSDPEADKAALRALVERDTTYFKSDTKGDSSENSAVFDDTTVGLWWRGPQTHDPSPLIEVGVSGDSAWVGWHQHNYGELIHWVRTSDTTAARWIKALQEKVQLNAIFRREGRESDADRGWKLKKISLVSAKSDTINTIRIDSLRIQSSLRNVLIVDPLNAYYKIDSLLSFTPAEQLTITLYTNAPDGLAFLHAFWGLLLVRMPFQNQGEGVFSGTWSAQLIPGFRFAIFDLIARPTLLDPTAPYDVSGWLLPYTIKPAD